jgi:hypothetical protein
MEKLDLSKSDKRYYSAKPLPELLNIGPAHYIAMTGKGDPSGATFKSHIETLYPVAYAIKFASKASGKDFVVAKLEGLWWYDETVYKNIRSSETPVNVPRSEWQYRLMIRMPGWIDAATVEQAKQLVKYKKPELDVSYIEFFTLEEGLCVQCLHAGAYDREPETLKLMHDFMSDHGLDRNGLHHEIYLSDFRKTSPEKLRTILRQPIK